MKILFDENFSFRIVNGLSELQQGCKGDNIEVLHVAEYWDRGLHDEVWIPKAAQMHAVAITQDSNIYRKPSLCALCNKYKLGLFFFVPPKKRAFTYWEWVENVVKFWAQIKELSNNSKRPFGFEINFRSPSKKPQPIKNFKKYS